jgi:hypothetical protein
MKIALTSDIHLEFEEWVPVNPENADVLILSGDICLAKDIRDRDLYGVMDRFDRSNMLHRFFSGCCETYKNVIYIMGNHEHYHSDFAESYKILKDKLGYLKNLHILEKEIVKIDDVTFIGGTLWTDMNKEDPITLMHIKGMMNDFRCVINGNRAVSFKDEDGKFHKRNARLTPEDAVLEHRNMIAYIKEIVSEKHDQKFVVVGHHAPSRQSTHPKYKDEFIMNGGYSSDLSDFILDRPQIKAWTHGHTHDLFDYMIGSTRVMCNPRGYVHSERDTDENEPYLPLVFEV